MEKTNHKMETYARYAQCSTFGERLRVANDTNANEWIDQRKWMENIRMKWRNERHLIQTNSGWRKKEAKKKEETHAKHQSCSNVFPFHLGRFDLFDLENWTIWIKFERKRNWKERESRLPESISMKLIHLSLVRALPLLLQWHRLRHHFDMDIANKFTKQIRRISNYIE